jgi:FkbM family methyltransferase
MKVRNQIGSFINGILGKIGYNISRNRNTSFPDSSMDSGLKRMRGLEINPSKIIDVGAAAGTWTEKAIIYWPNAVFELIEPLEERRGCLRKLKSVYPNINYHIAVAGENRGEVGFNVSNDLDGSGIYDSHADNSRKVPVIAIDDIVNVDDKDIAIKFDTHGYEIPILRGSINALQRASLLIIEVYGFRISPTCLLFHELTTHLDGLGFRLIDMVDIMRRPGDNAFWQADAFFIRKDHPVFDKNSYA